MFVTRDTPEGGDPADRPEAAFAGSAPGRRAELTASFTELLAVEPEAANGPALAQWLEEKARLQAALDGLDLAVTAAFDSSGQWGIDGARSTASWLACHTAVARRTAGGHLATARSVRTMVHVSAASLAGELCEAKVRLLTQARTAEVAEVFDAAESLLVVVACHETVDRLAVYLQGWRLRALETLGRNDPDKKPNLPDTEADRFSVKDGFDGRAIVDGELGPVAREILARALAAEIASWRRQGLLEGDTRPLDQLQAAALLAIVTRERAAGSDHGAPSPLFLVLLGLEDLQDLEDLTDDPDGPDGPGSDDPDGPLPFDPTPDAGPAPADDSDDSDGDASLPVDPAIDPAVAAHADDATDPTPVEGAGTIEHHGHGTPDPSAPDPARPPAPTRDPVTERLHRQTPHPNPNPTPGSRRGAVIAGAGPIPLTSLAPYLATADIRRVVIDANGQPLDVSRIVRRTRDRSLGQALARAPSLPLNVGRTHRHATLAQWLALVARSGGTCEVPGCTVAYWRCQAHHLQPWEEGGRTDLPNLLVACHHDHKHLIHRRGFTITTKPGGGYQLHRPDGTPVHLPYGASPGP